jgi:hypothetical protein
MDCTNTPGSFTCACAPTFANCDGVATNGCEVDLFADANNCGSCGTACSGQGVISKACTGGICSSPCASGWEDCNANKLLDGCEIHVASDPDQCGSCGAACPPIANGSRACANGKCDVASCATGFANCNNQASDGCETEIASDANNCGGCAAACQIPPSAAGAACISSKCYTVCAPSKTLCNGVCVDFAADPLNCGACAKACMKPANATPACTYSMCGIGACDAGYKDCNGMTSDGCESNSKTDANNCGTCGKLCSAVPNATPYCGNGACSASCDTGYANCDANPNNGCEVSVVADVSNCGGCGIVCAVPANASPTCSATACGFSCQGNFADCDKSPTNGCEVNLSTSVQNCGSCGKVCPMPTNATAACNANVCGIGSCTGGFANCNNNAADGCEINTQTDNNNCSMCGLKCATGKNCVASVCI